MPYNFNNKYTYTINYNKLYSFLIEKNILFDKDENEKYIKQWIHKLKVEDEKLLKAANTIMGEFMLWSVFPSENSQYYEFEFNISDIKIKIHFNIGTIHTLINEKILTPTTKKHSVNKLINSNKVRFTYEDLEVGYIPSGKPIIKAENHCYSDFWIIDGNHRLTYAIENNLRRISVSTLKASDIINTSNHCFATEFDRLCYIMMNEFYYLGVLQIRRGLSASEAIKYSYLNLNYFPFSTTLFGNIGLDNLPCIPPT